MTNGRRASTASLLLVTCALGACSDGDGRETVIGESASSAGADDGAGGDDDRAPPADPSAARGGAGNGEATTGAGASNPSGGDGICSPGIACRGIDYCTDFCWSDGCCRLDCWCDADPDTGNLECSLYCQ